MGEPKIENDRRNAVGAPPPHNLAPGHPTDGSSVCVCVCVRVWVGGYLFLFVNTSQAYDTHLFVSQERLGIHM